MDRREFIAGATGVVAASLSFPTISHAQTPQRGGRLRLGLSQGGNTDTLDSTTWADTNMYMIGYALGNNLVELGPDKTPIPELAESWDSSDGSKRWSFKIRKGVEFHNGKLMTPEDVVFSIQRHLTPESKSFVKSFLSKVTDLRVDGDNVLIELSEGDADMPWIMSSYQLLIMPEGFNNPADFVGTGAYRLEQFQPGGRFRATRNRNYWKADRGWFDSVEFTTIPNLADREQALVDGQVDAIDNVNFLTFDKYRDNSDYQALETRGGRFVTTVMDVRKGPFKDPDVREAMKYSVSRNDIIEKVLGYATVGNDHPVPPTDPFFHTDLPQRPFDPKKARWLLEKAGYDLLRIRLSASETAFTGGIDTAILMQDSASLCNIDLRVTREPSDGYWSKVWMQKPYVQSFWTLRATPAMMYSVAFACGAPSAEAYWCNDQFTQILAAAKIETDFDKRKQQFWDLQEITNAQSGNIIPAFISDLDLYSRKVGVSSTIALPA